MQLYGNCNQCYWASVLPSARATEAFARQRMFLLGHWNNLEKPEFLVLKTFLLASSMTQAEDEDLSVIILI